MERDEIIRLAKLAGNSAIDPLGLGGIDINWLERFAHLVAAEYKQDAERYRWLRHNSGYSIRLRLFGDEEMYKHRDKHLDELIDAAMERVK